MEKPFEDAVLLASVARAVEKAALRRESRELRRRLELLPPMEDSTFGMIGRSDVMQKLYEQIEFAARRNGVPIPEISPETLARLLEHGWPGNVRELRNTIERMAITA